MTNEMNLTINADVQGRASKVSRRRALRLAVLALREQARRFAFDASCFDLGLDDPHTRRAWEERRELLVAIEVLNGL